MLPQTDIGELGVDFSLALNLLLSLPILILVIVWIGSFFVAFISVARIVFLSGMLGIPQSEKDLSWGESKGRQNARIGRLLIAPEFARDWKRLAWSGGIAVGGVAIFYIMSVLLRKLGGP